MEKLEVLGIEKINGLKHYTIRTNGAVSTVPEKEYRYIKKMYRKMEEGTRS